MDKKTRPMYMLPLRDPSQIQRYTKTKVKGWKKILHAHGEEKKLGQQYLYLTQIDFKTKAIVTGKEQHYKMIKGTIQEEDITLVNMYTPNIGALNM